MQASKSKLHVHRFICGRSRRFRYKWPARCFSSHCSLGCVFCQNRKISRREAEGQNITADALAKTFLF